MNAGHVLVGLLLAVLVVANIATALLIVRDRHEHRQAFVELSRLEKARDALVPGDPNPHQPRTRRPRTRPRRRT